MASLKRDLAEGKSCLIVNTDHSSASLVAKVAALPIDGIFVDCEQGDIGIETIENMVRAARLSSTACLVRLFNGEDWTIERFLARGIDGIIVPRLDFPDQARGVVEAVKYCAPKNYQDKVVVIQIESKSAIDHLDEFLSIDGIDAFFIGPVDLAKSYGHAGQYKNEFMMGILKDTVARILASGKRAGMLVDRSDIRQWEDLGVTFLYEHVNNFIEMGVAEINKIRK